MNKKYNILYFLITVVVLEVIFWLPAWIVYDYLAERDDFRLEHPEVGWGFLFVPVLLAVYVWRMKRYNSLSRRFAEPDLLPQLAGQIRGAQHTGRYVLTRAGIGLLLIAMMNPQYGIGKKEAETETVEIMIALDVSRSMLAKDPDSPRNRLSTAKMAIGQFIKNLKGDKVGLVVFAGNAVLQLPVTSDYDAARLFLNTVNTETVSSQGTDIASALNRSLESLNLKNGIKKTIIVISDGENHEEDAILAAQQCATEGIIVHTIGIGSPQGVPIPELDRYGNRIGNKRDEEGNTVLSKLNEPLLKQIAQAAKGSYVRAAGFNFGLDALLSEVNTMERTKGELTEYNDYNDQFQWFLGGGILFLTLSYLFHDRTLKLPVKLNQQ